MEVRLPCEKDAWEWEARSQDSKEVKPTLHLPILLKQVAYVFTGQQGIFYSLLAYIVTMTEFLYNILNNKNLLGFSLRSAVNSDGEGWTCPPGAR